MLSFACIPLFLYPIFLFVDGVDRSHDRNRHTNAHCSPPAVMASSTKRTTRRELATSTAAPTRNPYPSRRSNPSLATDSCWEGDSDTNSFSDTSERTDMRLESSPAKESSTLTRRSSSVYPAIRTVVFAEQNIVSRFRAIGLIPYDP